MEDVNKCVQALQERDPENVDRTAGQIRGRTARLEDVVTAEMENYQQGPYTDNVMRAVMYMRNEGKNSSLYVIKSIFIREYSKMTSASTYCRYMYGLSKQIEIAMQFFIHVKKRRVKHLLELNNDKLL